MAVKKGLRRLTWLRSSYSSKTEIKTISLINKNVIIASTKEKKKFKWRLSQKKLIFRPIYFQNF